MTFHIQNVTQTTSASWLRQRCELEDSRNAWARVWKEQDDNEVEIDDKDYEIPSPSGDSEYSESTGWTEKSSEDDKDDKDEEDRKPRKSERKSNKKDGVK